MFRTTFARTAVAVAVFCAGGLPTAAGAMPAATVTKENPSSTTAYSKEELDKMPSSRNLWEFGLRAGYTGALHDSGSLESAITSPVTNLNLGGLPTGDSGYHPYTQGADLAFDVTMPFSLTKGIRPFATIGGFVAGGDSTVDGGTFGQPGFTGLSNAFLEERGNFYTNVGLDIPLPCETFDTTFHARPYTGFDVRMYQAGLRLDESQFFNPLTAMPFPVIDQDSSFTRVQPKIGFELVVPLCDHGCWGVSTYVGADYSFDVGGSERVSTLTPGGFPSWSSVNPGNVTTIRAGAQLNFNLGF